MAAAPQPFGRVRDPRDRRRAGWDLRFGVLMVFPAICLVVVLYEFLYLQQYTAHEAPLDAAAGGGVPGSPHERSAHLRRDEELSVKKAVAASTPATTVNGRRTMILIANYRDSKRCGLGANGRMRRDRVADVCVCVCVACRCSETLKSIFDNAVSPELLKISIFDQIYAGEGEKPCVEVFCELVGESACRRRQIVSSQIDAAVATVSVGC